MELKITQIGEDAYGVVLPPEALRKLNVKDGDTVVLTETPSGYAVSVYNSTTDATLAAGRTIMQKRQDMLRQLAKLWNL